MKGLQGQERTTPCDESKEVKRTKRCDNKINGP